MNINKNCNEEKIDLEQRKRIFSYNEIMQYFLERVDLTREIESI